MVVCATVDSSWYFKNPKGHAHTRGVIWRDYGVLTFPDSHRPCPHTGHTHTHGLIQAQESHMAEHAVFENSTEIAKRTDLPIFGFNHRQGKEKTKSPNLPFYTLTLKRTFMAAHRCTGASLELIVPGEFIVIHWLGGQCSRMMRGWMESRRQDTEGVTQTEGWGGRRWLEKSTKKELHSASSDKLSACLLWFCINGIIMWVSLVVTRTS